MLFLLLWLRLSRCQLSYSFALVFILLFANFVRFLPLPFPIPYVVVILLFGGCLHFSAAALSAYALSCSALTDSFLLSLLLHSVSRSSLFCACAALIVCVMLKRCKLTLQHVCCCCWCQKWFRCFFVFVFVFSFWVASVFKALIKAGQSWHLTCGPNLTFIKILKILNKLLLSNNNKKIAYSAVNVSIAVDVDVAVACSVFCKLHFRQ